MTRFSKTHHLRNVHISFVHFRWTDAVSGLSEEIDIPVTGNNTGVAVDISNNQVVKPDSVLDLFKAIFSFPTI